MRVLGLDPSLSQFGWSLVELSGPDPRYAKCLAKGRLRTQPHEFPTFVQRYLHQRDGLRALIQRHRPDKVSIESPVFGEMYSEGMYGLFLYCHEALLLEGMDTVHFSPGQTKACARECIPRPEKWKMEKEDMVEAARTVSGISKGWNHNEADAYWAGHLGIRFWLFREALLTEEALTSQERKVFLEIHRYMKGKKAGKTEHLGLLYREDDRFFLWSQLKESAHAPA